MSTSSCSNDEPQHHSGDDHSAASTDQDQLGSDNVDNPLEESRSESRDHNEKEDTDHEASSNADLALREQSAREETAVASFLLTMARTPNADLADDEVSLASTRFDLSSLLRSFKEVKPDIGTPNENDPESILSAVCAYLTESKKEISALSKDVTQLEEENKRRDTELVRMYENNKLLSSELRRLLSSLKEVSSGVATPNGDDPTVVFSSVRAYLTESKNKQSFLSEKLMLLEVENNKKSEDLGTTRAALEQANSRASTAEDNLERYLQEYKEIQEVLETIGQTNSKASRAKDKANKRGLELQKSKNKLKAAEDRPLEGDDVISRRKNVITGIEFSQEIVSRGIAHKIRWLADEFKRTCEDLGSTKSDLRQANFRADTAKKELEATKSNLEQANHKVSSAMDEANKRVLELQDSLEDAERSLTSYRDKATQWGKVIDKMTKVISLIKLPREVLSMDIARKVKWLTDERKRTCEDLGSTNLDLRQANFRADTAEKELEATKSNLEQANHKVSSAMDEANKRVLELQDSLEDAERSLTSYRDKATQWGKVIDKTKKVISLIKLPREVDSMDIARKVKWLTDERKRTCEELGSTKVNLEQANLRADTAEAELEMSKLDLEQANLKATREPGAMKLNLEQAKSGLNEHCTELKAAELEVKTMVEIKHADFPIETPPTETFTRIKWLADYYKNIISRSNQAEKTIRLLFNMKANICQKIADELSENIRVIVEAAVREATDVEDPNPRASSSPAMAHASRTEFGLNGSGTSTNERDATPAEQDIQNDDRQSSSTATHQIQSQVPATSAASSNGSSASESLGVVTPAAKLHHQQQTPHQPPGPVAIRCGHLVQRGGRHGRGRGA